MDAPCRIRAARSGDIGAVARIEAATFPDPWSVRVFAAHLTDLFLVAEGQDGVAGYVIARRLSDEAEILNVAVHPSGRGAGIGGALLDACLQELELGGACTVFLEVRPSNTAALRLYASRGFRTVGRRRGYYTVPREDALVLRRDTPPGGPAQPGPQ